MGFHLTYIRSDSRIGISTPKLRATRALSEGLRLPGSTHRFYVSDSRGCNSECFFASLKLGRTGTNSKNTHGVGIGVLTPSLVKANGAEHAEGSSGADAIAESIFREGRGVP